MDHVTWPPSFQGQPVVRRLGLARSTSMPIWNLYVPQYENIKGNAKCGNWVCLGVEGKFLSVVCLNMQFLT